ncbi:MAG: hypothetical protein V2A76_00515 [Planctomycetota bacterium]
MKRTIRLSCLGLGLVALPACYHAASYQQEEPVVPIREVSYAEEKRQMIEEMEREMNALMRRNEAEITTIRNELVAGLEKLKPPARLMAADRAYRGYGAARGERFDAEINRLVSRAVERTEALAGRERDLDREALTGSIQEDAFAIAAKVGGDGQGAGYGFISGVQEVDERARVTIELLQGFADVEGLKDLGELRRGDVLELNLILWHDLTEEDLAQGAPKNAANLLPAHEGLSPRVGRLSLFRSDVLDGHRFEGQDTVGYAVSFQNDRLPLDRPLGLAQGRRTRIVRGGMVVGDYPWQLDPTTPLRDGRLPLRDGLVDPRFQATEPILPGVNSDHDLFQRLQDFTVIYDFATGLLDEEQLELLGVLRWQIQWIVSAAGNVRVLPVAEPSFSATDGTLLELIRSGPSAELAGVSGQESPHDLLGRRVEATAPPVPPRNWDLGGGRTGQLASISGDTIHVSAGGRAYLVAHRLGLLSLDCRFFTYLEGRLDQFVLGLTLLEPDSALVDLGFRKGDALLSVNGIDIHTFSELWTFFSEHSRENRYEMNIDRNGALRRLVFLVEGVPPMNEEELDSPEELTEEMAERLASLFGGDAEDG